MDKLIQQLQKENIEFSQNISLKPYSTMRIGGKAKLFTSVKSILESKKLIQILKNFENINIAILGKGANTVYVNDFEGLVIKNEIYGKKIVYEDSENVVVELGAGEDWHDFVTWAVENNYSGVENLALIPGTIGASPVQNIAAYGQNLEDVFENLTAINLKTAEEKIFKKEDCKFSYRESIFKNELKNQYFIVKVNICLKKNPTNFEISYHERAGRYASLADTLKEIAIEPYKLKDIYNAVIHIRQKKLPDIKKIGTCGSFFKNAVVTKEKFEELAKKISQLQSYPVEKLQYTKKDWNNIDSEMVKIPVGRLIDELGWNGKWIGNVGISDTHGLCIVSNGDASSKELVDFVDIIKKSIFDAYGVELEEEVNLI